MIMPMKFGNTLMEKNNMEKLISELSEDCRLKNLTTAKAIRKNIFDLIWPNYEGKASRQRVKFVCDDLAESVCLQLGIAYD